MRILENLSSSLGRRDETPNQELAKTIAATNDRASIIELVHHLKNRDKNIQSDCIKVLYEIGEHNPALIEEYHCVFVDLLAGKNNRLSWGAMTALDAISAKNPDIIYGHLPKILEGAEQGSVITRDHAVGILIKLAALPKYAPTVFPLLLEQLMTCPPNQLAMYAENSLGIINGQNKAEFTAVLKERLNDLDKDSQKKRIENVLKKLPK